MAKVRIDTLLADKGLFVSRERARAAILAGEVRVDGHVVDKPGENVDTDADVTVAERKRFVSRGGEKLEGALATFGIEVAGRRCIDVGASTGGFTDCLLKAGAESVVALDVGYGQLAWELRNDARVTVVERANIRASDPTELGAPFDLVVCDLSFISLRIVLPHLAELVAEDGDVLALVKPQFEAGKGRVGKKGVVRDAAVHEEALASAAGVASELGMAVRGMTFSPITGPQGNIEFWLWASFDGAGTGSSPGQVVADAHSYFGG
jgi:23S rRNA (cytidine1920-2'-O)/16S rRNA (cytidine1409-2'-O)-methyltransferase